MDKKLDNKQFYFVLGDVIRHLRKESGIGKCQAAAMLGVSVSKYIAIEEGLSEISAYDLYIFARGLGVTIPDMFSQTSARFPDKTN